jgi:hypothetical protein
MNSLKIILYPLWYAAILATYRKTYQKHKKLALLQSVSHPARETVITA